MDESVDWYGVLKKPVDDAIDDLEDIEEDYSLSEGDWESVDDASDYLFEHKVKKRDIFDDLEDKKGHPVEFEMGKPRMSIELKNIPEAWSRRYRDEPGEDKPSRWDLVEEMVTVYDVVLKGRVTVDTSGKGGGHPIEVYTTITNMNYGFRIDYKHDDWNERHKPDEGYEQGGPKSYRMKDKDYSPIEEEFRVDTKEAIKPDALDVENSVLSGDYRINVKGLDEFVIDCHNSTEPKNWTHKIEVEW